MIRSEQPLVGANAALIKSDAELARRCRAGDSTAWEQVVHEYSRRVFNLAYRWFDTTFGPEKGLAYRFTGRHESAEDLTQEVFVRVYRSLDQYDSQAGDLANWLMRLARNLVIDDYRRRCRTPTDIGDDISATTRPIAGSSASSARNRCMPRSPSFNPICANA